MSDAARNVPNDSAETVGAVPVLDESVAFITAPRRTTKASPKAVSDIAAALDALSAALAEPDFQATAYLSHYDALPAAIIEIEPEPAPVAEVVAQAEPAFVVAEPEPEPAPVVDTPAARAPYYLDLPQVMPTPSIQEGDSYFVAPEFERIAPEKSESKSESKPVDAVQAESIQDVTNGLLQIAVDVIDMTPEVKPEPEEQNEDLLVFGVATYRLMVM